MRERDSMIKEIMTVVGALAAGVGLGYLIRREPTKYGVRLGHAGMARIDELHQDFIDTQKRPAGERSVDARVEEMHQAFVATDHGRYFFTAQTSRDTSPMFSGLGTLEPIRAAASDSAGYWPEGFAMVWDAKTRQPIELHEWDRDDGRVRGYAIDENGDAELKW